MEEPIVIECNGVVFQAHPNGRRPTVRVLKGDEFVDRFSLDLDDLRERERALRHLVARIGEGPWLTVFRDLADALDRRKSGSGVIGGSQESNSRPFPSAGPPGKVSILPSIKGELGRIESGPWQPLPLGEAQEGTALDWLWEGFIARGMTTDLYGLWKAGKSTLLGCLLREMASGGELAGRPVARGRALVVAEESAAKWERRAQAMGIPHGAHDIIPRPFKKQAAWDEWEAFIGLVAALVRERRYALVVFDSLPNLWPVRKENEAGEVLQALRPLVAVLEAGAAVLLVRHPRKSDGEEARAGRGSGAIDGFVDVIVEFRRYRPEDKEDTRRVFSVYSREEPFEVVAEFDGSTYVALGGRAEVRREERLATLLSLLPTEPPGLTPEEVHGDWPQQPKPGVNTIKDDLAHLLARGLVLRTGEGKRGNRHRWHRPGAGGPEDSILPGSPSIEGRIETETETLGQAGLAPGPARDGAHEDGFLVEESGPTRQERGADDGPGHYYDGCAEIGPPAPRPGPYGCDGGQEEGAAPEEGSPPAAVVVPHGSSAGGHAGRVGDEEPRAGGGGETVFPAEVQRLLKVAEASTCPRCGSVDIGVPAGERLGHLICLACRFRWRPGDG